MIVPTSLTVFGLAPSLAALADGDVNKHLSPAPSCDSRCSHGLPPASSSSLESGTRDEHSKQSRDVTTGETFKAKHNNEA